MKGALDTRDAAWMKDRIPSDGRRFSMTRATHPQLGEARVVEPDRKAVALALEHLLERNSVVFEFQVVGEASTNWR